ncbi:chemotaxis protein CheW [Candidatus Woesearchaeota archaeon]|nr:chemotaxis protein CheW [Candidatus Woesearchaeota archaeon]
MVQSYLKDIEDEIPEVRFRKVLVFRILDEEFGADISDLKEVVQSSGLTRVPNVKSYVSGIMNLKGTICPVIDLARVFNFPDEGEKSRILIVEVEPNEIVGIMVDAVEEIVQIDESSVAPPPPVIAKRINVKYLEGVSIAEDRMIILVDLMQMVKDLELGKEVQDKAPVPVKKQGDAEGERPEGLAKFHIPENPFWLDGMRIKNLVHLRKHLLQITDEDFRRYLNQEKNDFANWIEHEFSGIKDHGRVVESIRKVQGRDDMVKVLDRIIKGGA